MTAIRIYQPEGDGRNHRLRDAFEEFLLPALERARRSQSHISRHYTAVRHWERLVPGNPPVHRIDDACVQAFADDLLAWHHERGQRGNENVRKIVEYVYAILRSACRRGHSNKRGRTGGEHLIDDLPVVYLPESKPQKRRTADLAELSAAYDACEIAKWPRSRRRSLWDGPVELWRLLFVVNYNFGPRTKDMLALTWESVHWEPDCPAEEVSRLEWPHGWLVYRPTKTREKKPEPLHLPLTAVARAHLDRLRPSKNPTGPIFAFPRNMRDLHATRKVLWREAGIQKPYDFQDIRKTCSTAWNDFYSKLGEHVTGHAARGVNAVYYDHHLQRLCKFAPQLPQPEAFLRGAGLEVGSGDRSARDLLESRLSQITEEQAELMLKISDMAS